MSKAYYNEFDPEAAAWLRELIKNGLIADGEVDERSITEVRPGDLKGFTQCHFFAGIGGWSYALRLAGVPDDYPVWTGSPPCQPFSSAGKQKGKDDERHLWPAFFELITECRPITIFGEQVERAIKHGWLDDLQADLEREGYSVGAAVLGAHSVNAPHIRQRLYWVADSYSERCNRINTLLREGKVNFIETSRSCEAGGMGDTEYDGYNADTFGRSIEQSQDKSRMLKSERPSSLWGNPDWVYCRDNKIRPIKSGIEPLVDGLPRGVVYSGGEIDANNTGLGRNIRLKGYGNAIVPQTAALFIEVFIDVIKEDN